MSTVKKELVPSVTKMMAWTRKIFKQGIRRPGYSADYWAENWVKEQFEKMGLQDVTLDPVPVKKWEAFDAKLEIWTVNEPNEVLDIPCFPIPFTKPKNNLETELCMISDNISMLGKIAVSELELFKFPVKVIKGSYVVDRYYDPEDAFDNMEQIFPFDFKMRALFDRPSKNGIAGFIGILSGYPWETDEYYVPYDAVEREIPGVYVSRDNGKKILKLIKKDTLRARLSYRAKISEVISHNITGTLRGMSDEWIVIGTHHDSPWNSAVEDASGMVLVLAQAKYWSQVPKKQRPFNLMFLMNCAHMAGGRGAIAFVEKYKEFLKNVVVGIHLEHVARDVKSENGKIIPLAAPTVRWWFVSRIIPLEEIVEDAIIKENLERSILLPPDGFPPGRDSPPTDGSFYHLEGIPFISFLTAPPYLFDPADTLDKIHQESYEPLTQAVIRIINSLKDHTADELRSLVLSKKERKKIRRNIK
ncbi:MAG: M28 family peptidase [Candidatus Lokiarchaeota archaeon]|nr:M28 family peptidase [Candidatus Lokiarchaeota archaeon]